MFRELLVDPHEELHKRRLLHCVRVMSVGYHQGWSETQFHSNPGGAS
jgi:hypothetical protein